MNIFEKLFKRGSDGGGAIAKTLEAFNQAKAQNPQSGTGPNDYGSIMRSVQMLEGAPGMKKGGKVKSASARADGIAVRGKTRA